MDMVAAMANHGGVATVTVRGSSGRRLYTGTVTEPLQVDLYALDFYHLTYNVVFTPQNEGRSHAMRRDNAETVSLTCARAPHTHTERVCIGRSAPSVCDRASSVRGCRRPRR